MIKAQFVAVAAVMAIYIISVALAAPVSIEDDVKGSMKSAVKQGQALFGGAIPRNVKPRPATVLDGKVSPAKKVANKVHSIYTAGISSLGGGKPNRNDKHRVHNYSPIAPKVVPWNNGDKYHTSFISPEEAKQRWVPHSSYQYTSDADLH